MSERERLIELLKSDSCQSPMLCDPNCKYANLERCYEARTADYLLENGVIVPPVKVGDTVYTNCSMQGWYLRNKDRPYKATVVYMGINSEKDYMNVVFEKGEYMLSFEFDKIGKTVFLTREEAEKALASK